MAASNKPISTTGFTLIEALLYAFLLSSFSAMLFAYVFWSLDAVGRLENRIFLEEQAQFIAGKFHWALAGAYDISVNAQEIRAYRYNAPTVIFSFENGQMFFGYSGGMVKASLNAPDMQVNAVSLEKLTSDLGVGLKVALLLNGENFSFYKFLRQW